MPSAVKRLYWQLTALLMAARFAGWACGLPLVLLVNLGQVLHFIAWRRSMRAFDVQVRIAYLALLVVGSVGRVWPILLVQFVGVNALLVADYCAMARMLVLLPWNRRVPLTTRLVRWAILSPPAAGAIVSRVPGTGQPPLTHNRDP